MSGSSNLLRTICIAGIPVLLLAASWVPLFEVPPEFDARQFRENEDRFRALPESLRAEYRERLAAFNALPEGEREQHVQRIDVLRRTNETLARILGREPADDELAFQLLEVHGPLKEWLATELSLDRSVDDVTLRERTESEAAARIAAYLAHLVEGGRLPDADRQHIVQQPLSIRIREAIRLHAGEGHRGGAETQGIPTTVAVDPSGIGARLRKSERHVADQAGGPGIIGLRSSDGLQGDPLRQRMLKLAFIVGQLREQGVSAGEIHELIMLPMPKMERAVEDVLGKR